MTSQKMLTVKQVAEVVDRSPKTIYRWIDEGFLKNVTKIRDGYKIPEREVDRIKIIVNEEDNHG